MKKLIQIAEYHYVIDNTAEIKEGDWYYDSAAIDDTPFSIVKTTKDITNPSAEVKIICTTNNSLSLPLISNIEECLDLIDKEVEVELDNEILFNPITQIPIKSLKHPGYKVKPVVKSICDGKCNNCNGCNLKTLLEKTMGQKKIILINPLKIKHYESF